MQCYSIDDIFKICLLGLMFHVNHLLADDSHEISRIFLPKINERCPAAAMVNTFLRIKSDCRKPIFRICDKVIFKPSCSATETSYSISMRLAKQEITMTLIRLSPSN